MSATQHEPECQGVGAILILDDNQDDAGLLRRELLLLKLSNVIHSLQNAEQLIFYLRGDGDYRDREKFPHPALLLLDLRMLPLDGFDVLRWLKANPRYKTFPVVVVSGMAERHQITEAYRLGAKTFLTKPVTRPALKEALQGLNVLPAGKLD